MPRRPFLAFAIVAGALAAAPLPPSWAQPGPAAAGWTAEQDHQNMMEQLKITALRPGPSGDEAAPDHANYDESKANPFPDWPDILTTRDGRKVATADQWWKVRRPEIVEDFEREVLGRVPKDAPKIAWSKEASEQERIGRTTAIVTRLVGRADNSAYPAIKVDIQMMEVLPARAKGPVPLLVMFGGANFPAPTQPSRDELARINKALEAELAQRDPSLAEVFARHPGYTPFAGPAFPPPATAQPDQRIQELLADGWGVALLDPTSVQADNGAGLRQGIIGLSNRGQPRKPDDWGALRAWAWGASRAFDYLAADPAVDGKHIGVEGVSRYGKAALVTMAFDQRFAMVLVGSSGEGGAKPHRRNWGEAVESLTGAGEYHWMAGNFIKYGAEKAAFGRKTAGDLPVDSHELIALCAPRLVFISYGVPEKGDAKWLDHQGSFMATAAAGATWTLLGAKDLGIGNDYRAVRMPAVNVDMLGGQLAWRQHDGGHTDTPNMSHFIAWADRNIGRTAPAS
jgi:hypothetical protein